MKKKNLILLLLIALVLPAKVNAFSVNVAGDCKESGHGTESQLCYTGSESNRHITFITSTDNQKYFCFQEDKDLNEATYSESNPTEYTNDKYACAVYNALSSGAITIDDLKLGIGNVNEGTFDFNNSTLTVGSNHAVASVAAGSAARTYIKIQQALWASGIATAQCSFPYVVTVSNTPKINSLSSTALELSDTDANYYYSKVTVNKNSYVSSYTVTLTNAPEGTIISSTKAASGVINGAVAASEFYVLVKKEHAVLNTPITVKAETSSYTSKRKVTQVKFTEYSTTVDNNQTLGKLSARLETETATSSATTTIDDSFINFKICKVNKKDNTIKMGGVKFRITSKTTGESFELTTATTGADLGCATKANINKDTYTVTEVTTPPGYVKMTDGEVNCTSTASGATCQYNAQNTPITLKVKKIDTSTPPKPLVNAKMKILKADGTDAIPQWTSVEEDKVIDFKDMPFGKYTLVEEEAPNGYVISTSVEFEIYADHYIVNNETKQYTADATVTVTMIDEPTKVSILKVDTNGNPLKGAVLVIEDVDGNPVTDEWTTDGTPKVFTNLDFGTYYLVEISAPDGYILNEERVEFTISQTSADDEVIIENEEVPSTASSKSALLISFAMLDVAIGIAIVLYVRKRQILE